MPCQYFIRFSHNSVSRARWVPSLQACGFSVLSVLWTLLEVHHCIVLLIRCSYVLSSESDVSLLQM